MSKQDRVRRLTQAHKAEQVRLAQATGVAEMGLVEQLAEGALSVQEFRLQAVAVNRVGHDSAASLAGNYVRQTRGVWLPEQVDLPVVTPVFDTAQSLARAESTVRAVDKAVSDASRIVKSVERVARVFRQWTASNVANAHRRTIIDSAEAALNDWRVVTDGNPCAFCAMLASYGEDINGAWAWPNHYFHHDCGCTIQEVPFGVDVEFTAREREFIRLREQAEKEADKYEGKAKQRLIAAMRANGQGVVNDAIEGSSSGRKLLKQIRGLELSGAIKSKKCRKLPRKLTSEEITRNIGRPDLTEGSCGSVAYAYAGNRAGLDVHDFRGGESQRFFATAGNTAAVSKLEGVLSWSEDTRNEITGFAKLLNNMEKEKEYILGVTKHAAIIKKTRSGGIRYLELQGDGTANGWKRLDVPTLMNRFGAVADSFAAFGADRYGRVDIISVESLEKSKEFLSLLPYINT